jgi:hypothetical protein
MVRLSRILVAVWAAILVGAALLLSLNYHADPNDRDLIDLAFRMVAYVYGPLLGILILAIVPWPKSTAGIVTGAIFSMLGAAWALPDAYNLLQALGWLDAETAEKIKPDIHFAWLFPINAVITMVCGVAGGLLTGKGLEATSVGRTK